jgi:hypothetical protein
MHHLTWKRPLVRRANQLDVMANGYLHSTPPPSWPLRLLVYILRRDLHLLSMSKAWWNSSLGWRASIFVLSQGNRHDDLA